MAPCKKEFANSAVQLRSRRHSKNKRGLSNELLLVSISLVSGLASAQQSLAGKGRKSNYAHPLEEGASSPSLSISSLGPAQLTWSGH
jgi:hypothetical protein